MQKPAKGFDNWDAMALRLYHGTSLPFRQIHRNFLSMVLMNYLNHKTQVVVFQQIL